MNWFEKLVPERIRTEARIRRRSVPEGIWTKCDRCSAMLYREELERNQRVCPKCDHHMRLGARKRLEAFLDEGHREEIGAAVEPVDFLRFRDSRRYRDRLNQAQRETAEKDALIVMSGRLKGMPLVASAFEFDFMAGSMGSVVGEKFVRGANIALERRIPLVCFTSSGGARMQEALLSLMQMAKTAAVIGRMSEQAVPYVSVLTDPTTGGVSASLAMLGDVNVAEPEALVGFAGPRVIEQTVRETLPEGFQRSEFLLDHGVVDMIVDRRRMRDSLFGLLSVLTHWQAAGRDRTEAPHAALSPDRLGEDADERATQESER